MSKPAPSLPVFGSDWPPVARTTAVRSTGRRCEVVTMKSPCAIRAGDVEHATAGLAKRRAGQPRFPQQRVEHVARAIGVGKQLAAGLLVQADADLAEERDGGTRRNARRMRRTMRRASAQKSASVTMRVRDVAARRRR